MTLPLPEYSWHPYHTRLAIVSGTESIQFKIPDTVPDWVRHVYLSSTIVVRGLKTGYEDDAGNHYIWTPIDNLNGDQDRAQLQIQFCAVNGEVLSSSLSGWLPMNQDHRTFNIKVDLNSGDCAEVVGGNVYLMAVR